ncbi:hypothetical protein Ciccas_006661 [Cichlidogyrus casuarinus]|uniref:Uncharacterized protein n=1 Tax=Cichlidogyrus casuarinus TaxID=1844966 RepID=A0ABD2Q8Z0_9PLAT
MSSSFEGVCETTLLYNIAMVFFFHFPIIYFLTKIGFLSRRSILTAYSRIFGHFFLCFGYAALVSEIISFDFSMYLTQGASDLIINFMRNYPFNQGNYKDPLIINMAILLAVMLLFSHMKRHQQRLFLISTFVGLIVSMTWGLIFVSIYQWDLKILNSQDIFGDFESQELIHFILEMYFRMIGPSGSAIWIYIGSKLPRDCSETRIIGFILLTLVEHFVEVQIACRFRAWLFIQLIKKEEETCENALDPEATNYIFHTAGLVMGIYAIHGVIRKLSSLFLIFEDALDELGVNKRKSGLLLFTILFILMELFVNNSMYNSFFLSNEIVGSIGYLFPAITMLVNGPISSLNAIFPAHQSCILYKVLKYLFMLCIILTSFGIFSMFMILILLLAREASESVFDHFAKLALLLVTSLYLASRHEDNTANK